MKNIADNRRDEIEEKLTGCPIAGHESEISCLSEGGCFMLDVSDEGTCDLELAYALTIHKAQGSEFGKAILVLREPGGLLSKELRYTAISRQKDKLIILYNDGAYRLSDYSSLACSEVARRFTCLFEAPNIVEYKKKYYE